MSGTTTELNLATAVDADDNADYLTISLRNSLITLDSLFNNTTGHTHTGAHQGGPVAGPAAGSITGAMIQDGSIGTADLANASVTNAKLASDTARDNLLTNGGFEIWQRGVGPFTTNGAFTADRWLIWLGGGALSVTRDNVNANGRGYCAAITATGGMNAGAPAQLYQYPITLADADVLRGRTVTFSVKVKTSTAGGCFAYLLGVGGSGVASSNHSGSGFYETLTVSTTIPAAASGIILTLAVNIQAAGTYYVDDAMMVLGSQAADFVPLHPADDLARCLRYYEPIMVGVSAVAVGQAFSTTAASAPLIYRAIKPVTPTITFSTPGNYNLMSAAGGALTVTSISAINTTQWTCDARPVVASGLVGGNATALAASNANTSILAEANP